MNAYEVETRFTASQKHIVIADSMGEAEELFMEEYPESKIDSITKISCYVIVKKEKP